MKKRVTQKDIAKALGVSVSTVGLVVGGSNSPLRKYLNKETIRRVEKKAREMGYEPNRSAQIIRRGRSNLIIFLYMAGNAEWVAQRAYHVGRLVHEHGYDYQTVDAYWWVGDGQRIVNQLIALQPEGVVVAGSIQAEMDFSVLKKAGIPVVSLDADIPNISQIRHGVRAAIRELTLAAIRQDRKFPGLLVVQDSPGGRTWQREERVKGFRQAVKEAGLGPIAEIDLRPGQVVPVGGGPAIYSIAPVGKTNFASSAYSQEMAALIGRNSDALICANDHWALGAMTHYQRSGILIPEEIAISGFDNVIASTLGPVFLTTVEHPTEEMSEGAMRLLLEEMKNPAAKAERLDFPCTIIWRESLLEPKSGRAAFPRSTSKNPIR